MIFKCDKCGYSTTENIGYCPLCFGIRKPEKNCTCLHYSTLAGPLNVVAKKNKSCPIHGKKSEKDTSK